MNKIEYGTEIFDDSKIIAGNCVTQHSMMGESLAYDTLEFTIWEPDPEMGGVATPFTDFVPGEPLLYYFDDRLINKFYLNDVKRTGQDLWTFTCVSAVGYLEKSYHPGGMYNGTAVSNILDEILYGLVYEVDPVVADIKVYGWLPYGLKRDNLHQITLALALGIKTKSDGTLFITALSNDVKGSFGNTRLFMGGSVESAVPCTAVQVSEHYYQQGTDEITLYDDAFVSTETIFFSEPVYALTVSGGTITESGANYAIVQGSGAVLLKGKRYIHTIKKITEGTITGEATDKILQVNDIGIITSLNSKAVAKKLYDTFALPMTIKSDVLLSTETPGDVVNVYNPYTEGTEIAFLRKINYELGEVPKVNAEFLVDYLPSGAITGYQNRVLITEGTSWTKPAGVTDYRAILIGAGDGAQAGLNGANGDNGVRYVGTASTDRGDGGEGGNGGLAGNPGKIFDTGSITVDTAEQTISLTIGAAGTGGASNGASGTTGGETTLDTYTSADGQTKESGYVDILQGDIFALPAKNGIDGGKGQGDIPTTSEQVTGHDDTIYYGGVAGATETEGSPSNRIGAAGGGGGGAAVGDSNPADTLKDGTDGYIEGTTPYGGDGGRGGNADAGLDATVYGGAGNGGHGGGGGGGGGCTLRPTTGGVVGTGGPGGTGGAGGDGKQGCIIIYY